MITENTIPNRQSRVAKEKEKLANYKQQLAATESRIEELKAEI